MSTFLEELKRRNVVRVGIAYIVLAWVVAQVAELALESFEAPAWVIKTVLLLLALGLPIALFFAWAFELTPEGLKKEKDIDRSQSITAQTGRKLDYFIIGVLAVALAWFAWDKFIAGSDSEAPAGTPVAETAPARGSPGVGLTGGKKSVAVLPFVAMSSGEDDDFFADGLTEEILNALAQLPELLVTARTSAFSFKGQDLPVQEIAKALNVNHIVEGSVRRAGERLRVTAQLIRADDGFHLWSENYDSESRDIISVQEDIATEIATSLDIYLDETKLEYMRRAGLRDPQAYIDLQKGLDLYNRAHGDLETNAALARANEYFDRVIERVPDFDAAYVFRSDRAVHLLFDNVTSTNTDPEHLALMDEMYRRAVEDYELAIRHAGSPERRASHEFNLAFFTGDWRGLPGRIEQALADESCGLNNWLPNAAMPFGYAKQYLARTRLTLACDPRRSAVWFNLARAALWSNERGEALRRAEEGMEKAPGSWLTLTYVHTLVAEGRYDEAERTIERRLTQGWQAVLYKALIAAQRGNKERYASLLEEFKADHIAGNEFWLVPVLAWGGRRDEVNAMAAAVDRDRLGPFSLAGMALWCACGAPWDLEATPVFAKKLEESGLAWPPASPMSYSMKDW